MKTLTALLLASGMAVTMVPSVAVAQDDTPSSGSTLETQLDGATINQISSATNAVIVYVDDSFDLSMSPANIADVRTALEANSQVTLILDSREVDTPDVVGVAANGETSLMVFVDEDPADESSLTGTMSDDGMINVEGDVDGEMDSNTDNGMIGDDDTDVDAGVGTDTDVDTDTQTDGSVDTGNTDANAETDTNVDVDAGADVNVDADENGVSVDGGGEAGSDVTSDTSATIN